MKNTQENIYRVKSLMKLLNEQNITIDVDGKDNDPYDYKKTDGKFYTKKATNSDWVEVKDQNVINSIKEKYFPDTLSIDSNTELGVLSITSHSAPSISIFNKLILSQHESFIIFSNVVV